MACKLAVTPADKNQSEQRSETEPAHESTSGQTELICHSGLAVAFRLLALSFTFWGRLSRLYLGFREEIHRRGLGMRMRLAKMAVNHHRGPAAVLVTEPTRNGRNILPCLDTTRCKQVSQVVMGKVGDIQMLARARQDSLK